MGLAYYVEQAVEEGKLKDMLDPAVPDWPLEEATSLAKLSLQCAELRRKDRPDLGKEVMPVLNRLREMGEESLESVYYAGHGPMSHSSQVSYTSFERYKDGTRPKVNKEEAHSVDDVQRLYIVMRPESGENPVEEKQDSLVKKVPVVTKTIITAQRKEKVNIEKQILLRFIVMGKKTLPDPSKKSQPFWGFVEMVTKNVEDVKEALKGADPPDFLNYEGCEFLLISASDDIEEELGVELESEGEGDESSCDLVKTFGDDVDATPLLRGTWD
ncbi:hypothetical protein Bca52824_076284 [Brassica carinata]|uniref:Uncharacterized protein n=1 Tax=Brassica carinata TaxID=52824 RepID=A0A8X7PTJ2_BRACI|nr:hypothetical protein Bca52824_076284 [Brassica carinata]